jgi:hypothetical protein
MKWTKPMVASYTEDELLAKLAAKAQTHGDTPHSDGPHVDI